MSFITGVGLTPYGKHEGSSSLDLMSREDTARAQLIVRVVALIVLLLLLWAAVAWALQGAAA